MNDLNDLPADTKADVQMFAQRAVLAKDEGRIADMALNTLYAFACGLAQAPGVDQMLRALAAGDFALADKILMAADK